jgi:hypothetical protein
MSVHPVRLEDIVAELRERFSRFLDPAHAETRQRAIQFADDARSLADKLQKIVDRLERKRLRGGRASKSPSQGALPRRNPRGKYAYDLLKKDITLKQALARFNEQASKRHWDEIASENGIKYLATRYAQLRRLDPVPPRRPN